MIPYLVSKELLGMRLSNPRVNYQWYLRPRCLNNYCYFSINTEYLPIYMLSSKQYGWTLERLIIEVVLEDLSLGPVYLLKADRSDGFYCIALHPDDSPNLGLMSPSAYNEEDLVAIPLTIDLISVKAT